MKTFLSLMTVFALTAMIFAQDRFSSGTDTDFAVNGGGDLFSDGASDGDDASDLSNNDFVANDYDESLPGNNAPRANTPTDELNAVDKVKPEDIKSLEDIRELGSRPNTEELSARGGQPAIYQPVQLGQSIDLNTTRPDPKKNAQKRLEKLRKQLGSSPSSEEKIKLRAALMDYFIVDMRHRVKELDEIKERTKSMEKQLARRLRAKDEVVELQIEVLLNEAAGLGFYSPTTKRSGGRFDSDFGGQPQFLPSPYNAPSID